MNTRKAAALLCAIVAGGVIVVVDGAEPRVRRSVQPQDTSRTATPASPTHSASRGSVRYHASPQDATITGARSGRGTADRRVSPPVGATRSVSGAQRSQDRSSIITQRPSTTVGSYHVPQTRHRAAAGSVRHYQPVAPPAGIRYPQVYPGRFPGHHLRSRDYPRYGTRYQRLPVGYRELTHRGHRYYYLNGVYYRPYGDVYMVVRPPIGTQLPYLPVGYAPVLVGGQEYYRYNNTFYTAQMVNQEPVYVVVQPPTEVIVDVLPPDARTVYFHGTPYYVDIYEEVAYAPVVVEGLVRYRLTDLDVDVDIDDGRIEIDIDD